MASRNPYETYQNNSVTTASPGELTLMLYNGCLKFINLAKHAIENKQIEQKNTNIQKAQNIISELMLTLNMDVEISNSMRPLYEYANRRLLEANIQQDISILEEVEEIMTEFRDVWKQAIQVNRKRQYTASGSVSR